MGKILQSLFLPHQIRQSLESEPEQPVAVPVAVERSNVAQGINNASVVGDWARTYTSVPVTIKVPVLVSNGDFSSSIVEVQTQQVCDAFFFNPPPDGLVYLLSLGNSIDYRQDVLTQFYTPTAEYVFCNMPGFPIQPMAPIPLQRRRQKFRMSIWSDRPIGIASQPTRETVPIWFTTVYPVFLNLGEPR